MSRVGLSRVSYGTVNYGSMHIARVIFIISRYLAYTHRCDYSITRTYFLIGSQTLTDWLPTPTLLNYHVKNDFLEICARNARCECGREAWLDHALVTSY